VESKGTSARLSNLTCSPALLISCSVFSASAEKTSARSRVAARLEVGFDGPLKADGLQILYPACRCWPCFICSHSSGV
jgi:hypothetical protein